MSQQSITIKTVTAPAFKDLSAMLTPRLKLVVSYTLGGTSFLTGATFARGYEIAIQHDRKSDQGFTSLMARAIQLLVSRALSDSQPRHWNESPTKCAMASTMN